MTDKKQKQKMTKDVVPENFTMGLTLVDAVPVVFFGLSFLTVGALMDSPLFIAGVVVCLISGLVKVLWKFIVVLWQKNIWPLFVQMRILMPIGFILIVAATILSASSINFAAVWSAVISFPAVVFFCITCIGMVAMCVFAIVLDSSDVKSNWIEQLTNGAAQIACFAGILCTLL